MLSESDAYLLKKFRDQNMDTRTDMVEKKVLVCYDSNSGGYNGEIIFDLSSLGVASDYLDYGNAFITVPYVCSMKSAAGATRADISASTNKTTVQPKDGFHHLIDSMSIEVNGRTVQSIQNFSNMFYHMKYLMSASTEDVLKNSATSGVFGEGVTNYAYNDAAGVNGIGYSPFGLHADTRPATFRQHSSLIIAPDTDATALPWINPSEIKNNSAESYYSETGVDADQIPTWVYYYTIKLSHISSFFENLPLTKATDIKLIIKYNSFSAVITTAASKVITLTSYTQLSGRSCPLMLCPFIADAKGAGDVTMTANIASTGLGEVVPFAHKQCRLYVPSYKIRPDVASAMITSFPQTKVQYFDIYSYSIPSIQAGGQITYNLTNGVTNPVFVMVLPFQRDVALAGKIKGGQYQSIFDSAPATTSGTFLKDLQIQVGGKNTFQLNETYSYDQFINEFSKFFALNGNSTLGVTSGLINQASWNKGYRCYVADISRREPSEDNVSKAVVLTGSNASAKDCELICFVAYRKSLTLNTATGIVSD